LNKQIDLTDCVGAINQIIEKLNEKCEEKGMKKISVLKKSSIDRDLPQFGELYQEKQKYEYVLSDENQLDLAMAEMEDLGIQHRDVSYLLQ
jgi:PIN domain nuclease of toxin-antitoxin system